MPVPVPVPVSVPVLPMPISIPIPTFSSPSVVASVTLGMARLVAAADDDHSLGRGERGAASMH